MNEKRRKPIHLFPHSTRRRTTTKKLMENHLPFPGRSKITEGREREMARECGKSRSEKNRWRECVEIVGHRQLKNKKIII